VFLPDETATRALADTGPTRAEIRLRLEVAATAHLKLTTRTLYQLRGKSFVRWRPIFGCTKQWSSALELTVFRTQVSARDE